MDEARSKRGGGRAIITIGGVVLVLLLMLYVLSSAESFLLVTQGRLQPNTFNTIYAPLIWLSNYSTALSNVLTGFWQWYTELRTPPQPVLLPGPPQP